MKKWPVGWNRNGHIGRKSIDLEALSDTKCWSLCLLVYMVSHLLAPTSLSYQPPTLLGAPSINLGAPILTIKSCIQSNMKEAIQDIRQTSSSILMQRLVTNWGIIQNTFSYFWQDIEFVQRYNRNIANCKIMQSDPGQWSNPHLGSPISLTLLSIWRDSKMVCESKPDKLYFTSFDFWVSLSQLSVQEKRC